MLGNNASYRGLILSAVVINLAVVIAFVVLTTLQFDQTRTGLEQERLKVVADRAAEPLASAAAIGLDLSSVRNVDAVLERAKQADNAIVALYVLDLNGAIVASTDGGERVSVSAGTLQRLKASTSDVVYRENGDFRYLITFENSTGNIAGALLMEYSGAAAASSVWAMAGRLATAAMVFCIIGSVFLAWAIRAILRSEIRIDREFVTADAAALRRLWRGSAEQPDGADRRGMAAVMHEAELRYHAAREKMT